MYVCFRPRGGYTALHLAAAAGQIEAVSVLLAAKADATKARHFACEWPCRRFEVPILASTSRGVAVHVRYVDEGVVMD